MVRSPVAPKRVTVQATEGALWEVICRLSCLALCVLVIVPSLNHCLFICSPLTRTNCSSPEQLVLLVHQLALSIRTCFDPSSRNSNAPLPSTCACLLDGRLGSSCSACFPYGRRTPPPMHPPPWGKNPPFTPS